MILYTIKGSVYTSRDNGFTWVSMQQRMHGVIESLNRGRAKSKTLKFDGVTSIIQNKQNRNMFIFTGNENVSFKTKDCGKMMLAMKHKKSIEKVSFHPVDQDKILILVTKKRKCLTPLCLPNRNLFLSTDFGSNFKKVEKNVIDFSWAYVGETASKKFPKDRVIFLKQVEGR
jgi:hypothetical protein